MYGSGTDSMYTINFEKQENVHVQREIDSYENRWKESESLSLSRVL